MGFEDVDGKVGVGFAEFGEEFVLEGDVHGVPERTATGLRGGEVGWGDVAGWGGRKGGGDAGREARVEGAEHVNGTGDLKVLDEHRGWGRKRRGREQGHGAGKKGWQRAKYLHR